MVQEDLGKIEFTQVGKFGARGLRSNLRSQGVKNVKFSQNQVIFAENRNYLNNYTSQEDCKTAK